MKIFKMKEIKYKILSWVFVKTFLIPFSFGSGTVIKVPVPTFCQVPVPQGKKFLFLRLLRFRFHRAPPFPIPKLKQPAKMAVPYLMTRPDAI